MAWKNHEKPKTKVCTSCKRDLPYDREHYHMTAKKHVNRYGVVTVRYYAQPMCKRCRLAWMRDMAAIDAVLKGRRQRKVPEHLLAEAVALVRNGHASRRGAAKLVGINPNAVREAVKSGRQFAPQPRMMAAPVREAVQQGCLEQGVSVENLCKIVGVTARLLYPFDDGRPDTISVVVADRLLTALELHHRMPELERLYRV